MKIELEQSELSMLYLILGYAVGAASKDGDTLLRDDFLNFTRKIEKKAQDSEETYSGR